jgi:hypothetical protein
VPVANPQQGRAAAGAVQTLWSHHFVMGDLAVSD